MVDVVVVIVFAVVVVIAIVEVLDVVVVAAEVDLNAQSIVAMLQLMPPPCWCH